MCLRHSTHLVCEGQAQVWGGGRAPVVDVGRSQQADIMQAIFEGDEDRLEALPQAAGQCTNLPRKQPPAGPSASNGGMHTTLVTCTSAKTVFSDPSSAGMALHS